MKTLIIIVLSVTLLTFSCEKKGASPKQNKGETSAKQDKGGKDKGIGPIKEVKLGPIDKSLASKGKKVFEMKCSACHKLDERVVGPPLRGVTKRRTPEFVMNMILNPKEMVEKNATAHALYAKYYTQMSFQDVTQKETRSILEYFRESDSK
ncbi:MAG TPA: cytochrome c [Spirochaetes bacterium]|nr:cytochrome c [Spirochaetota bacterium]